MTALEYLKTFDYLPVRNIQCAKIDRGGVLHPSNNEVRRWLLNGSVIINGCTPGPSDTIPFPIEELIFFPKSKGRTTIWAK